MPIVDQEEVEKVVKDCIDGKTPPDLAIKTLLNFEENVYGPSLHPITFAAFHALDAYRNNQGIKGFKAQENAQIFLTALFKNDLARKKIAINVNDDQANLDNGVTLLHRAAQYHMIDIAQDLIKLGANIHQEDRQGLTPFFHCLVGINQFAVRPTYCPEGMEMVKFLVSEGSKFDVTQDKELMDSLLFKDRPDFKDSDKSEINLLLTKAIIEGGKPTSAPSATRLSLKLPKIFTHD